MPDYMIQPAINNRLLEQFYRRYNKAQGVSDLWAALHQACYYYGIPARNKYWRPQEQQGEMRGQRVYDTTAIEGVKTFVSKIHTAMTPPQTQWGFLMVDEQWAMDNKEDAASAQKQLDEYMRRLFSFIFDSNFDVVINECYFDLSIGTACLVCNAHTEKQPLLFTSIPMDKLAVEESLTTGRLESWYRSWDNVKIHEIDKRWPKAKIPEELKSMTKQDPDATINKVYEGVMYVPTEKDPYCYIVCTKQHELYHEYFKYNPGIVWRFQKTNNDVYGRGPMMDALPSIISLNELARIELAAANMNTFKPYMAFSDAVFNPHTFNLQPMTIIPIAPIGSSGQPPLIPLPDATSPQFSQLLIQDLRMQIQRLLFADSPIPQDSKQPASATELMIAQQELAQRIGPLFSRLQQEFLWPVIQRVSYVLETMGLLAKPKLKGVPVTFAYRSPLALAKGMEEVGRFQNYYQTLQGMFGPEFAQMFINPIEFAYALADKMQLDVTILNDPDMVKQTAQNAQNQMSQMQESANEQMQQAGTNA